MAKRKRYRNTRICTVVAAALLGVVVLLVGARATSQPPTTAHALSWTKWNSMGTGYDPS